MTRNLKPMLVEWHDHCSMWQGWTDVEQAEAEATGYSAPTFVSAGLLFHQDKNCVILIQSIGKDGSHVSDGIRILTADIVKITPLLMRK